MATPIRHVRISDGLWTHLVDAAKAKGVSVSELIRDRCTPGWTTPQHEEIHLSTVNPEDLGLDPFNTDDPLVRAITQAA
jgi:hypothetical protein